MATPFTSLAQAYRRMAAAPGSTALAILMVALGVGASTAIFSAINGVLLAPLPVEEPAALVRVWESNPGRGWERFSVAEANFLDWRARNRGFTDLAAFALGNANLTGRAEPEQLRVLRASAGLLPLLGVEPRRGRLFTASEDAPPGNHFVAVLDRGYWQRRLRADPAILGKSITLDGQPYEVIGVVEVPLRELRADVILPLAASLDADREDHELAVLGRLRLGTSLTAAQGDLMRVAAELATEHPETNSGWGVRTQGLFDSLVDPPFRRALAILAGAVACLLLVAGANFASLLLGRALARGNELAVRTALGASRRRLVGHLLGEVVLISLAGGALGALLAAWGVDFLRALDPGNIPRLDEVSVDGRVLLFAFGLALAAGLAAGLLPAWRASAASPRDALQQGGRGVQGGLAEVRLQAGLVVFEVALSLVVLVGAGLLLRSYDKLTHVELGLALDDRLVAGISVPAGSYPRPDDTAALYRQLLMRLEALPAVASAAAVNALPFGAFNTVMHLDLPDLPPEESGAPRAAQWRLVTPAYFRTLGVPLLRGRAFTDADDSHAPDVAIISQRLAELFWPGEEAVGKRLSEGTTIVGVVADVRERELASEPAPMVYFPFYQARWPSMPLVIHVRPGATLTLREVRAVLAEIDPRLPVAELRRLDDLVADSLAPRRFNLVLLCLFAAVALVLAVGGLYGVVAGAVGRRRREIGVRVALGATTAGVVRMVLRWGLGLAALGLGSGLLVAALLSRTLTGLLYGVQPLDPLTYLGVAGLLLVVSLAAAGLPARAAGRVLPRETLAGD